MGDDTSELVQTLIFLFQFLFVLLAISDVTNEGEKAVFATDHCPFEYDLAPDTASVLALEKPVKSLGLARKRLLNFLHCRLLIERGIVSADLLDRHITELVTAIAHQLGVVFVDLPDRPLFGIIESNTDLSFIEDFLVINSEHVVHIE